MKCVFLSLIKSLLVFAQIFTKIKSATWQITHTLLLEFFFVGRNFFLILHLFFTDEAFSHWFARFRFEINFCSSQKQLSISRNFDFAIFREKTAKTSSHKNTWKHMVEGWNFHKISKTKMYYVIDCFSNLHCVKFPCRRFYSFRIHYVVWAHIFLSDNRQIN